MRCGTFNNIILTDGATVSIYIKKVFLQRLLRYLTEGIIGSRQLILLIKNSLHMETNKGYVNTNILLDYH